MSPVTLGKGPEAGGGAVPPPPPAPPPPPPLPTGPATRLLRSREDRVLGGVAGGLGRSFGVDPVVPRIGFAALALAGGLGVLAYLVAWLAVPEDDGTGAPAPVETTPLRVAGFVLAGILALVLLPDLGPGPDGSWVLPTVVVLAAAYALARQRGIDLRAVRLPGALRALGTVGLVVGAGAALAALAAGAVLAAATGGSGIVAVAVLVLGVLLVGSAWLGGARWLLLPALALAAPAGAVAAADLDLEERRLAPAVASTIPAGGYEISAGVLFVDLRSLPWRASDRLRLPLSAEIGEIEVLVPERVCVRGEADAGVGEVDVLGRGSEGPEAAWVDLGPAPAGRPALTLDAEVDVAGVVRVRRGERDGPGVRPTGCEAR